MAHSELERPYLSRLQGTVTDMNTAQTFDLPAARLADASKRVARFARKATALGMSAPSLSVTHEYQRTWIVTEVGGIVAGPFDGFAPLDDAAINSRRLHVETLPMVRVVVAGERPVIEGWEFAATIEHTPEGNLLNKVPGFIGDLPAKFRDDGPEWCDHCKTGRKRNNTYVLRHVETGKLQRVGRTCLQHFLADASPAAWMATFAFLQAVRELSEWDDGMGGFESSAPLATVPAFLAGVIAVARTVGYVSASDADGYTTHPTGDVVQHALTSTRSDVYRSVADLRTAEDFATAKLALAWIASDDAGDSDYIHNLRVVASTPHSSVSSCRRLASIVPSYRRDLARKAARAARVNEYLSAEIGERPIVDATVEHINTSYHEQYGTTYWVKLRTFEGHAVSWKTSAPYNSDDQPVEVGETYRVLGKVDGFEDYKGHLTTKLSRCNLWSHDAATSDFSHDMEAAATTAARHELFESMQAWIDTSGPFVTAARKWAKQHGTDAPRWAWTDAQIKRAAKAAA